MLSAQTLLMAMAAESPEADRRERRLRIWAAIGLIIGLAGFGGAIWVLVQTALYGWATTDWERMSSAMMLPLPFALLAFFSLIGLLFPQNQTAIRSRMLRDALAQGDERVAPVASLQPQPLAASDGATRAVEFHTLRRISATNASQASALSPLFIVFFLFLFTLSALPEALGWSIGDWVDSPLFWIALAVPILLFLVGMIIVVVLAYRGPQQRWDITAEAEGLTWRERGRRAARHTASHTAPWSAIRVFFKAPYHNSPRVGEGTAFVVDTGTDIFGWVLGQNSKDDEFAESERLSRLIVTRTGLPLREMPSTLGAPKLRRGGASALATSFAAVTALPENVVAEMAAMRKRVGRRLLATLPLLLIFAIVLIAAFQAQDRLRSAQKSYFAKLAPQVYASKLLFSDSLAGDDGLWPVATPNASSDVSRVFTDGSYQVSGGDGVEGDATVALTQQVVGDTAVEVTARTIGFSDVGLALRAQGNGDLIAFTVNQASGEWALDHYQYGPAGDPMDTSSLLAIGTSSAVHMASGSVNHLLVVMRGDTYLLYVNDQLLDVASQQYDYATDTLYRGQVGVYVDDTTVLGVFTNFAVHATPPTSSVGWV